jgi:hypothetical protein
MLRTFHRIRVKAGKFEGCGHRPANSDAQNAGAIMRILFFAVYLQPLYEMAL